MSTWVKVADTMPDHPKMIAAGDSAAWLYVCGLCYCSRHLTDGEIPRSALNRLTGLPRPAAHAAKLLEVGLWEETETGWRVHDYGEHQRTKQQAEHLAEANRERQRRHRDKRPGHAVTNAEVTGPEKEEELEEDQETRAEPAAPAFSTDFERTWAHYPRKEAKKVALEKYQARRREGIDPAELHSATQIYAHVVKVSGRAMMLGQTFYGPSERWKDFLDREAALAREQASGATAAPKRNEPSRTHLGVVRVCQLGVCDGDGFVELPGGKGMTACRCRTMAATS